MGEFFFGGYKTWFKIFRLTGNDTVSVSIHGYSKIEMNFFNWPDSCDMYLRMSWVDNYWIIILVLLRYLGVNNEI